MNKPKILITSVRDQSKRMETASKNVTERYGILFVHGIVGNNRIFDFLRPLISPNQGRYVIKNVELNGHGGNALDFSRASMSQWKTQVEEAVTDLGKQCEKIVAIGHSMGCLLVMEQASKNRMAGLFLLNPPMRIKLRLQLFTNALKVITGNTLQDPVASAAKEAYGISLDFNPLHYYGWHKRYIELFAEIIRAKKSLLPDIDCPVKVILSRRDEMVSLSSAEVFKELSNFNVTILPDSTHYYYSAKDRELICREFTSFMSNL